MRFVIWSTPLLLFKLVLPLKYLTMQILCQNANNSVTVYNSEYYNIYRRLIVNSCLA